jgi:NADH-quinone oxidoreductase subunit E
MPFKFNEEQMQRAEALLSRYPDRQSGTLPLLHLAQEIHGWISPDVIAEVANVLGVTSLHVSDVASFYTMYQRQPVGRHLISVCRTLSCHLLGGAEIIAYLRERLQLGDAHKGTDPKGLFTLEEVECLGACGTAPAMIVDGKYHENMTIDDVAKLLDRLEAGEEAGA